MQEIFTTLTENGDATNYASAVEALNDYFVPQVNSAFARQTFHRIRQNPAETVQQFVTRLKKAAKDCDFAPDTDKQIRDAFWISAFPLTSNENCLKKAKDWT